MCELCGIDLPESGVFSSPFREDNNPSCDVWNEQIVDRTTNERFDVIGVFAAHNGITNREAIRTLAKMPAPTVPSKPEPLLTQRKQLCIPPRKHRRDNLEDLATLRGINITGPIRAAETFETLGFAMSCGFNCWILSDARQYLAEARRMDGKPFPANDTLSERKSHTLPGSVKSWPIGIECANTLHGSPIVLCEGGPDYLTACSLLQFADREFLPVAMLGAGQQIHATALPLFRGRHVRILAHPDNAGLQAATRWSAQLIQAGATIAPEQLLGGDLNDLVKQHGEKTVAKELNL